VVAETHQAGTLTRREPSGVLATAARHENFRSVLVVAGGQGAGNIIRSHKAEPEPVPLFAMLCRIGLKVVPEFVRQYVLVDNLALRPTDRRPVRRLAAVLAMQDAANLRSVLKCGEVQIVPTELHWIPKADDDDAFAVLRHEMLAVDDLVVNVVAKLVPEHVEDGGEGAPLVMARQVFAVLQQESFRLLPVDDPRDIEKKCALRDVRKAVRPTQRVLFGHPGNREWLTGEAGQQHVVFRD